MQLASINVGSVGGTAEKTTRVGVNANLRSEQPVAAAVSYKVGTAGSPSKTNVVDSATNSHNYDVVYSSTGIANPVSGNNEYLVDIKENGVIVATGKVAYDAATNELVSSTIDYKGASPVTGSMTTTRINAAGTTVNLADLGIVNASGADDAEVVAGKLYDPSTWSMSDYAKDNSKGVKPDFEVQIPLSDSKGGQRTVTLSMLKGPGPNQWYAELRAKPGDLANNGNGQISTGIIEFTTDGKLKNTGSLFGTTSPTAITIKSSGYIAPTVTPPAVQPPTPPTWADALGIDEQEVQIDLASAMRRDPVQQPVGGPVGEHQRHGLRQPDQYRDRRGRLRLGHLRQRRHPPHRPGRHRHLLEPQRSEGRERQCLSRHQ